MSNCRSQWSSYSVMKSWLFMEFPFACIVQFLHNLDDYLHFTHPAISRHSVVVCLKVTLNKLWAFVIDWTTMCNNMSPYPFQIWKASSAMLFHFIYSMSMYICQSRLLLAVVCPIKLSNHASYIRLKVSSQNHARQTRGSVTGAASSPAGGLGLLSVIAFIATQCTSQVPHKYEGFPSSKSAKFLSIEGKKVGGLFCATSFSDAN